jgi:uncharacterized SAM-binding protein YcdF (DUF218 family)
MSLYRFGRNLLAIVGLIWILISFTPIDDWWSFHLAVPWGSGDGDVLVVLSSDSLKNTDILGESSYWRAVYTVRAIRQHTYRRIIITGASQSAELMRDFVAAHGIPASRIEVETTATSTRENALKVRPMLAGETGKIVLLTSDFHVWRSLRVFRKVGLEVEPSPVPDGGKRGSHWQNRSEVFTELCLETLKTAWYYWQGWI